MLRLTSDEKRSSRAEPPRKPARRGADKAADSPLNDDDIRCVRPLRSCFVKHPGVARHDPSRDLLVPIPGRIGHDGRTGLSSVIYGAANGVLIRAIYVEDHCTIG